MLVDQAVYRSKAATTLDEDRKYAITARAEGLERFVCLSGQAGRACLERQHI
jgi:hypothetical protein